MRDPRLVERFLQTPEKLFAMDGKSGLGGHIERIRRYAKQNYANDYFPIVPAMLIAAQISRETEDQKRKQQLFQASKLQDFLDSIRVSLIKHGLVRRSQTLLGSTVGSIEQPERWIKGEVQEYEQLIEKLKTKRSTVQQKLERAKKDTAEALKQLLEANFQVALNLLPSFAEDHWKSNEISMKSGWEERLKAIKFESSLQLASQEASQKFTQEVQEILEEVGNELQLVAELKGDEFKFSKQKSGGLDRDLLRITRNILGIAATVLVFFPPLAPIGAVFGVSAFVAGFLDKFFKTKGQRRHEAVEKITSSLSSQIQEQKILIIQKAQTQFYQHCESIEKSILEYFDELIEGLTNINVHLGQAQTKLSASSNLLNRAYAKRIIDHCLEQREPLNEANISKTIFGVKREFGRSIVISTKSPLQSKKSLNELKEVLQENISIPNAKF